MRSLRSRVNRVILILILTSFPTLTSSHLLARRRQRRAGRGWCMNDLAHATPDCTVHHQGIRPRLQGKTYSTALVAFTTLTQQDVLDRTPLFASNHFARSALCFDLHRRAIHSGPGGESRRRGPSCEGTSLCLTPDELPETSTGNSLTGMEVQYCTHRAVPVPRVHKDPNAQAEQICSSPSTRCSPSTDLLPVLLLRSSSIRQLVLLFYRLLDRAFD